MLQSDTQLTRRLFVGGLLAAGGVAIAGCGSAEPTPANRAAARSTNPSRGAKASVMTVYRDPSCGCCEAWAAIAQKAGYTVRVIDHPDMAVIKRQYGVPEQVASCHTALIGEHVVEGHVPLLEVARLVREKPPGIRGIAVPGMPLGSPGMETSDGLKQPFQVLAFDVKGAVSRFA